MAKKKISIGTWAFIWGGYKEDPIPFDVVLDTLKKIGYDGIEFGAFAPHLEANTDAGRKKVAKMLKERGLGVSGVAAPFPSPTTSSKADYLNAVKANLDVCSEIGSPKLRVDMVDPPTKVPGGLSHADCVSKVAEIWHASAEECAKRKIQLVWEFEPGFYLNKPSEVVDMAYRVDHPNFSIMFDACHAYMGAVVGARQLGTKELLPGGVVQYAHMLTGKIGAIHLIDSDGSLHDNDTSTHNPLGTGKIDFGKVMPAILESGYADDWWPIDLCFWAKALEVAGTNKKYVDKLVKKFG
jgi:sugar phosphate isomerase/epimerase